jgi:carotenoid cleavage dioxygenase
MRVIGTVVEAESGKPLEGLWVRAYDKDWILDDELGDTVTDAQGNFEIKYTEAQFRDLEETLPDVYIRIYDRSKKALLHTSEKAVRRSALVVERFDIEIPRAKLEV